MLDGCGALHYRRSAERELGTLGHRPHRRTQRGDPGRSGIESLTERELQVARLVVDRKTNPEIAAELFLSQKTVETHLSNIFNKMGVATRVELARAVERADQTMGAKPADSPWRSPRAARGCCAGKSATPPSSSIDAE
jgi:DNA-binding NarL/FixJ family response regulator